MPTITPAINSRWQTHRDRRSSFTARAVAAITVTGVSYTADPVEPVIEYLFDEDDDGPAFMPRSMFVMYWEPFTAHVVPPVPEPPVVRRSVWERLMDDD